MNEFELIEKLTRSLPSNDTVITGAGDDCAVLDLGVQGRRFLFKTDAVVEGIHFTSETPPEKIGHKALARCLSDIASMGGLPTVALVTIGLPTGFDAARIESVYDGMNALARRHGVAVAGGETTTNPERLLISVAVLGWVEEGRCILRSGAREDDAIFVTGDLGGSIAGRHLDFEPRLAEARWLTGAFTLHAMMDLSDGLAGDLRHILKASGVGAELRSASIPISCAAKLAARTRPSSRTPLIAALSDGEDFELLFTIASRHAVPLLDAWKAQFPELRLTCIGKITAEKGIRIRDKHGVKALTIPGYEHFSG